MLDHHHRVPPGYQVVEDRDQVLHVVEVQPGRRFVEEVDSLSRGPLREFPGNFDPLRLTAREGGGTLPEFDVAKPNPGESLEFVPDRGDVLEEGKRLLDAHIEDVGDGLPAVLHLEGLLVVARPLALLTFDVDVREEVHLDLDEPVALAGLAPPALEVEREPARLVAPDLRLLRLGKDLADIIEDLGVGRRV